MKKQSRGFLIYIALIIGVIFLWYFLGKGNPFVETYSQKAFEKDMNAGKVVKVEIDQSRDVPTGTLYVDIKKVGQTIKQLWKPRNYMFLT